MPTEPLKADPVGKKIAFATGEDAVSESKFCSDAVSPASTVDAMNAVHNAAPFGYTGFGVPHVSSSGSIG